MAGGFIAGVAGWQSLFFVTLALALILAAGAWRVLPDAVSDHPAAPSNFLEALHQFDVPGGLLLAAAAGFALFGVTEGQVAGFTSPVTWGSFLIAVVAAVGFVWRIRSAPEPFVSPNLFRNPAFIAAIAVGFFMMFANVGTLVLTPFLLSEVNGLSAAGIGLVLAPGAAAVAILSPVAGRLSDRFGPRALIRTGLVVMLLSTFGISTLGVGASAVTVALGVLGLGLGFSIVNSPTANAAAATLSAEESGVGLGIFQLVFFLGGGFGPAVTATFLAFRQAAGGAAINPFHALGSAPFSDAFLLIALSAAIALVMTLGIRQRKKGAV